jgi:hypothetical protein
MGSKRSNGTLTVCPNPDSTLVHSGKAEGNHDGVELSAVGCLNDARQRLTSKGFEVSGSKVQTKGRTQDNCPRSHTKRRTGREQARPISENTQDRRQVSARLKSTSGGIESKYRSQASARHGRQVQPCSTTTAGRVGTETRKSTGN